MSQVLSSPRKSTNVRSLQAVALPLLRSGLGVLSHASPGHAGRLAAHLFTTPRRFQRHPKEAAILEGACRIRIPMGSGALSAWRWGRGPTVLLVHGWEGRGSQLAAMVDPLVKQGHTVVTFDAPAHGDSQGRATNLLAFADAISAAERELGPLHGIVAHSMGAAAALFAVRSAPHPPRLALISPANASQAVGRFVRFMGFDEAVGPCLHRTLDRTLGVSIDRLDGPRLAQRFQAPLLVVHDVDDPIAPYDDGAGIAALAPRSELMATEGMGHHKILRDPEVVRRITAFMGE